MKQYVWIIFFGLVFGIFTYYFHNILYNLWTKLGFINKKCEEVNGK